MQAVLGQHFKPLMDVIRSFADKPPVGVAETNEALARLTAIAHDIGGPSVIALPATIDTARAHLSKITSPELAARVEEMLTSFETVLTQPQPLPPELELALEMPVYQVSGVLCDKHPVPDFFVEPPNGAVFGGFGGFGGCRPRRSFRLPRAAGGGAVVHVGSAIEPDGVLVP